MHFRDEWIEFWFFGHDGTIDVSEGISGFFYEFIGCFEELFAVDIFVLWVGIGKVIADVAEVGCAKNGVTDGVEEDVGVGVAEQAEGVGDVYSSNDEFAAGGQSVGIVPKSYANVHGGNNN